MICEVCRKNKDNVERRKVDIGSFGAVMFNVCYDCEKAIQQDERVCTLSYFKDIINRKTEDAKNTGV